MSCAVYALPQAPIFRLVAAVFTCCVLATGVNPTNGTQAREAPRSASSGSAPHEEQLAGAIEEIWKKSQILRPEPSTDTTPVSAKVGNVTYSIPREYISNLHLNFPVLKVTYPGFKPLTEETRGCFDPKLQASFACTTLELNLRLSLPNKPRFENEMKLISPEQKRAPRHSTDGYDVYDLGPENARIEIYRSEGEDVFFTCNLFDNHGTRDAVCDDAVSLADGNAVQFFFSLKQIGELRSFETGIRQLMSQFTTGGSK